MIIARREKNQVWNGAKHYDFEPSFLAAHLYMNLIFGLADKYYDNKVLEPIFARWKDDKKQDAFDRLAWIILEKDIYEKEIAERPALERLKKEYSDIIIDRYKLRSKQDIMSSDSLSCAVEKAYWSCSAFGLFPKEKRLFDEIMSFGSFEENKFIALLEKYYKFSGKIERDGYYIKLGKHLSRFIREHMSKEVLQFGRAEEKDRILKSKSKSSLTLRDTVDQKYAAESFGNLSISKDELLALEKKYCTGSHKGCHLWYTSGDSKLREAKEQEIKNKAHYLENNEFYQSEINRLTAMIKNSLIPVFTPSDTPGRFGTVNPKIAWKNIALKDEKVFIKNEESSSNDFKVEILLDASASRLNQQELISAQAYILSESLRKCQIKNQVTSFCSIRGTTVMQILKDFNENDSSKIFRYFASGWNRDALAIMASSHADILLVLTDANPNDSRPIQSNSLAKKSYEGKEAIDDTALAVRHLRQEGINVSAIFMGRNDLVDNVKQIYGKMGYTRIKSMEQFASSAGRLIASQF